MIGCSISATVLLMASSLGQLSDFRPLPELRANEVEPRCRVLTPENARAFEAGRPRLSVGENLTVLLPVQLSTAYTWRVVRASESALEPIGEARGQEDLRSPSQGYWTGGSEGKVGGVDAVQVFRYRIRAAERHVPLQFELVRSFDGDRSGKTLKVNLTTHERL